MHDLSNQLLSILARYAGRRGWTAGETTPLSTLGIDDLDIPMILLDVEDRLGLPIDTAVAAGEISTAGDLITHVRHAVAQARSPRRLPRKKSNWMSTNARA